jgi:hypothetical protein
MSACRCSDVWNLDCLCYMLVSSYSLIGDGDPLRTRNPNEDGYVMSFVPMMGMWMGTGIYQTWWWWVWDAITRWGIPHWYLYSSPSPLLWLDWSGIHISGVLILLFPLLVRTSAFFFLCCFPLYLLIQRSSNSICCLSDWRSSLVGLLSDLPSINPGPHSVVAEARFLHGAPCSFMNPCSQVYLIMIL